jgi:hypothetical protein
MNFFKSIRPSEPQEYEFFSIVDKKLGDIVKMIIVRGEEPGKIKGTIREYQIVYLLGKYHSIGKLTKEYPYQYEESLNGESGTIFIDEYPLGGAI